MCHTSAKKSLLPWLLKTSLQVYDSIIIFLIFPFMRIAFSDVLHCTRRKKKVKESYILFFLPQILCVYSQKVISQTVSLKNSGRRKCITTFSAKSVTAWVCLKKKEHASKQPKRSRCLIIALSLIRI